MNISALSRIHLPIVSLTVGVLSGFLPMLSSSGQDATPQFEGGANDLSLNDDFSISTAQSGKKLNGSTFGKSRVSWEATSNATLLNVDGIEGVGTKEAENLIGRVGVPVDANIIEIEARVRLSSTEQKKGWVAIGIGNGQSDNPTFGGLYFLLDSDGRYILLVNRDPKDRTSSNVEMITIGPLTSFDAGGWNTLRLVFDKSNNAVSAWANDKSVVTDVSLTDKGLDIQPEYVGISSIYQIAGIPSFDSVSLKFLK